MKLAEGSGIRMEKLAFPSIIGNKRLCGRLRDDILDGTLSHAYIIEGAAGTGKHTLARQIAAALSCENRESPSHPLPCGSCLSCRKILGGFSPDLLFRNRGDKTTLGVEVIRELRQDILVAPNDTEVKVYVIEDAHLMTPQAQNAFLLTLEEPPKYVLFLLLCESTATLLETIRSRAPTLRTEPIDAEEIGRYLTENVAEAEALKKSTPEEFSEILASADGSIGRALELLDPKARRPILARRKLARDFVSLCTGRKNTVTVLKYLNSLSQKRDELTEQLSSILLCLRDLLLCKQTENAPLCFFADREDACTLAYTFTTPTLLHYCEQISAAMDSLRVNANVRLTLTTLAVNTGLL